ncbi:uncharacterized protein LOC119085724 [Bradysia coprophila]|uniref:uncharacterized protein LOC119085724 n=1 Tax=Bradysia coprophila TaxID=38358 RepID=UPI00187D9FD9|nr:uncharacterized protein LOC119085724 [Bradysia coprophila]
MLNGKFYTGLTENQLNRSAGPNRQKTNFFWPDESETTPKNTSPRSRNNDVARKYNAESGEVRNPKELFKTQLSSKIKFYDTTDASKTPPSVRKQNQKRELNRNVYEKNNNFHVNASPIKPKTFESKIEFYDFVETEKPKEPTAKVNSAKMVHEKKKISFDEADEWDKTKKGILKNRDVGLRVEHNVPIDISEHRTFTRNNGSKLQLSKSMDNVAKLKLSYNDDHNDRNEKVNEMANQLNKLNINNKEKINFSRQIQPRYEDDGGDYNAKGYNGNTKGYNDRSKYNIPTRTNERQSQRNSFHGLNNDNFEFTEERYSTTKNYDDKGSVRRNSDQYDHKERTNLRKHLHTKNNTFNDRLQATAFDETDEFFEEKIPEISRYRNEPRNERVIQVNVEKTKNIPENGRYRNESRNERVVQVNVEKTKNIPDSGRYRNESRNERVVEFQEEATPKIPESSRYRNEPRNERAANIKRSSTINGANDYPNEARRRAHTHLQSNIFFQDDERLQQQRPLSIRESAVTRVGVGLPDII